MPEYGKRSNRECVICIYYIVYAIYDGTIIYRTAFLSYIHTHVHNTRSLILVFRIKFHGVLSYYYDTYTT